ncbi:MAG: nitrate reductase molybdenum cofactor assembly chaperone [Micropepsaceae bacterium]
MKTFRALGTLLTYPTDELLDAMPDIRHVLQDEGMLEKSKLVAVDGLLEHLARRDLMDAQDEYVSLFDRVRSMSLHLYEHLYGEAGERGQAMVRLQTLYKFHGFTHLNSELPDYLPMFCEFLSLMPERTARTILSDAAAVIEALQQRAAKRGTPYASVFAALTSLASREVDRTLLAEIMRGEAGDEESFDALDRDWEEAPVTFGEGDAAKACAPTVRG